MVHFPREGPIEGISRLAVMALQTQYLINVERRDQAEWCELSHELGLFTDDQYRRAFRNAGLDLVDSSEDLFGYGLYVCRARR